MTAEHLRTGKEYDASLIWTEDPNKDSFKVCLREMQNFDGKHEDITVVRTRFNISKNLFVQQWNIIWWNMIVRESVVLGSTEYRVSQKFVPLITCDITLDRNYTSAWNFLTTFIALLSTYIRKVNIRHALLCLLSRSEAVAAWNGISHVAWRAGFSSRLVWAVFSDP